MRCDKRSKMFRLSERLSPTGRAGSKRYIKRAGLFAAGLVLLWTALHLSPTTADEPPVYSDEAGSVASSERVRTPYQGPRIFTLGNLAAVILLIGGGGFAYYLHQRSTQGSGGISAIESIGELPIGQGQQLRLIRCGGEILLIGATAHHISLLRDFDPRLFDEIAGVDATDHDDYSASDPQRLNASTPQHVNTSTHFADVLRQYAGRYVNIHSNGRTC